MSEHDSTRRVAVVLYQGFETLDVAGPVEMFGLLPDHFEICCVGPATGPVRSAQGPAMHADYAYREAPPVEVVLVPGGHGTRALATDADFCAWLASYAEACEYICSVCTGAGLLAAAGLLDGRRATTNKQAFAWPSSQGKDVTWVKSARWVVDGNRWTSSGVSAGMDMALALIGELHGEEVADSVAVEAEYERHHDASWDPFAAIYGLSGA